jgi:hypothetical protein
MAKNEIAAMRVIFFNMRYTPGIWDLQGIARIDTYAVCGA